MIGRSIGRAARGAGQLQAAAKAPTGTRALRIGASSNLEGPLEGDILSKTLDATDPAGRSAAISWTSIC
jgi:hypothetical protein